MENSKQRMADLVKELEKDRLISITIGETGKCVQMQQKVLEGASEWFGKALRHDIFVEGKNGKLDFPDDDVEVWNVLIYWLIHREVLLDISPVDPETLVLAAQCYILGDKYDIKVFQDEVMLQLIQYFELGQISTLDDSMFTQVAEACCAPTKLSQLVAEELANDFSSDRMSWERLGSIDMSKIWKDFCTAQTHVAKFPAWVNSGRMRYERGVAPALHPYWVDYMVAGTIKLPVEREEDLDEDEQADYGLLA